VIGRGKHHGAGERIPWLRREFRRAAKRAKLDPALVAARPSSCLRSLDAEQEESPVHVMKAVGHSKLDMTMYYYKFAPEQLKALVEEPVAVGQ